MAGWRAYRPPILGSLDRSSTVSVCFFGCKRVGVRCYIPEHILLRTRTPIASPKTNRYFGRRSVIERSSVKKYGAPYHDTSIFRGALSEKRRKAAPLPYGPLLSAATDAITSSYIRVAQTVPVSIYGDIIATKVPFRLK